AFTFRKKILFRPVVPLPLTAVFLALAHFSLKLCKLLVIFFNKVPQTNVFGDFRKKFFWSFFG
ncbi:hypothetical protein, partial [Aneurinibacillus thermoaerophilus]|uniref:hypothetical protein n=1 Tax=Aneurinibacillus thermoaerophilus TaxID=143495 RepID=UPI002E24C65F|nr:hypothetical protein [Aneurinibacillus thermoaerophilus]